MYLKRNIILSSAALVGLFQSAALRADGIQDSLNLSQALARAESAHPVLEFQRAQVQAAREQIQVVSAWPDPKFQVTHFGESIQTRTGAQERAYVLQQAIPAWGETDARRSFSTFTASAREQEYNAVLLTLREEVSHAYAEAFYFEKACASTRESLILIEAMRTIAEEQVRTGAPLNALLRFELESERTRDDLARWSQKRDASRSALASLLNLDRARLGGLVDLPEISGTFDTLEQLYTQLQIRNPSLKALREKSAAAKESVRLSRLDRYPKLSLGLNYIEIDGSGSSAKDAGEDPWGLSLAFNLPLWQGKKAAAVQASRAKQRAVDAKRHEVELTLREKLETAYSLYADSEERMRRYTKDLIPLAEQGLEHSRAAYSTGGIGALELLDSEQALLDLRLRYWRALADLHRAASSLNALIGGEDPSDPSIKEGN